MSSDLGPGATWGRRGGQKTKRPQHLGSDQGSGATVKLRLQVPGLGSDASPAVQERGHTSATGLDSCPLLCSVGPEARKPSSSCLSDTPALGWEPEVRRSTPLLWWAQARGPQSLVPYLGLCPH